MSEFHHTGADHSVCQAVAAKTALLESGNRAGRAKQLGIILGPTIGSSRRWKHPSAPFGFAVQQLQASQQQRVSVAAVEPDVFTAANSATATVTVILAWQAGDPNEQLPQQHRCTCAKVLRQVRAKHRLACQPNSAETPAVQDGPNAFAGDSRQTVA